MLNSHSLYPIHYTLSAITCRPYSLSAVHSLSIPYSWCSICYTLYAIPYWLYPICFTLYYSLYATPYVLSLYATPYVLCPKHLSLIHFTPYTTPCLLFTAIPIHYVQSPLTDILSAIPFSWCSICYTLFAIPYLLDPICCTLFARPYLLYPIC